MIPWFNMEPDPIYRNNNLEISADKTTARYGGTLEVMKCSAKKKCNDSTCSKQRHAGVNKCYGGFKKGHYQA